MLAPYIQSYGYWVVFFGAVLEGETILILAGFSVSRGYLEFLPVLILAVAGAMVGDGTYFLIGRRYGPRVTRRFPSLKRVRARAVIYMRQWGRFTAFVCRFAYGLRIVLPLTMGAARVRPSLFFTFNFMGATCFALLYLGLGYLFGEAMEELLGRVRPYERRIVFGVIAAGTIAYVVRKWWLFRSSEQDVQKAAAALRASRRRDRR